MNSPFISNNYQSSDWSAQQFMRGLLLAFLVRLISGVLLSLWAAPVSIDDSFRVFHAVWWSEHPNFASQLVWLPGYAWIYGSLIALTREMILAPRLLSLAFQLATGAAVAIWLPGTRREKFLAACLAWCAPLAFSVGSLPLSEAATGFFLIGGALGFVRFRLVEDQDQKLLNIFCGGVSIFLATTLRYEAWACAAVFFIAVLLRRPRAIDLTCAALSLLFPILWTIYCFAIEGVWFSFLTGTRDDHFGPSSIASLFSADGLLAIAFLSVSVLMGFVHERANRLFLWFAVAFLLLISAVALKAALPSQYPIRLWYVPCLCASVYLARSRFAWPAIVICVVFGGPLSFFRSDVRDLKEQVVAGWVANQSGHVVIGRKMPESTTIFVYANSLGRVHLDGIGKKCPLDFFGRADFDPSCEEAPWLKDVSALVTHESQSIEFKQALKMKFHPVAQVDKWILWELSE